MSKGIPSISSFMTTSPHTIGKDQPLAVAHGMMREHQIRHLLVLEGNALVGVISDRDVALIEALRGVDPKTVRVEDAMTQDVLTVAPEALIDDVVGEMAARKAGSAVIMQNHKVVGIFTAIDAMNALVKLLHTRLK